MNLVASLPKFEQWFLSSPQGRKLVSDHEKEIAKRRADAVVELERIKKEADEVGREHAAKMAVLNKELDAYVKTGKDLGARLDKQRAINFSYSTAFDRRVDAQKRILAETCNQREIHEIEREIEANIAKLNHIVATTPAEFTKTQKVAEKLCELRCYCANDVQYAPDVPAALAELRKSLAETMAL